MNSGSMPTPGGLSYPMVGSVYPTTPVQTNIGPFGIIQDKEYKMFVYYGFKESAVHLDLLALALRSNTWELLDLDLTENNMLDTFRYLKDLKRYRRLQNQMTSLYYTEEGFFIDGHQFETLDQVEKAIKNKAFL